MNVKAECSLPLHVHEQELHLLEQYSKKSLESWSAIVRI